MVKIMLFENKKNKATLTGQFFTGLVSSDSEILENGKCVKVCTLGNVNAEELITGLALLCSEAISKYAGGDEDQKQIYTSLLLHTLTEIQDEGKIFEEIKRSDMGEEK